MQKKIHLVLIGLLLLVLSCPLLANSPRGGWANDYTIGSADNGAPGFIYRSPLNRTQKISGPIPSNEWWSGVLVKDDVLTLSPYPLIVNPCIDRYPAEDGLFGIALSYKGEGQIAAASGGPITGFSKKNWKISSHVHYDLIIRNDQLDQSTTKTRVDGYGDWHVDLQTADQSGHRMNSTIVAGSPYMFMDFQNGQPVINTNSFGRTIEFYERGGNRVALSLLQQGQYRSDHLIVKILHPITQEARWYALFAADNTVWSNLGQQIQVRFENTNGGDTRDRYLIAAILPSLQDAELFYNHAYLKITGTRSDYNYDQGSATITSTFNITTMPLRMGARSSILPLITLFPHQYKNLHPDFNSQTQFFKTMRGKMKLFIGNRFKTVLKNHGILHSFNEPTQSPQYSRQAALEYLYREQGIKESYNVDTYGGGKAMLRVAESIVIADKLGREATPLKEQFIESLYREFADWFTYSPGEERTFWSDNGPHHFITYFAADRGHWGHLTGWRAGFGTQALNDMHFHYGYWIHAAAILAQYHPTFVREYGWAIEELIRNIASPDRGDRKFPYLRYFSPYMGRSFSSGWSWDDNYAGNDQESTSEAMNAWAGVYLWGLVTENRTYRDLGLYLYWSEKSAIDQYWLDVDDENLHPQYPYSHAVILRETAYEFETFWGSRYIEELYGIQMLPMTAATLYLGLNQSYANKYWNEMWAIHENIYGANAPISTWNGIMLRFLSLINPQRALQMFQFSKNKNPRPGIKQGSSLLDQETWTSTYFFMHNLNQLGRPSQDFYGDSPSFGVFKKDGGHTFVGYNPSATQPLTIRFKDASGRVVHTMNEIPPKTTIYE